MHPFPHRASNSFESTRSHLRVLIEAVGRGSQAAFKRLYELESGRLYGASHCVSCGGRRSLPTCCRRPSFQIWQNAAAFSAERGVGAAWLTGIVRFRSLDAVRKLGREVLTDDPALGDAALEPDVIEKLDTAAETGGPEALLQTARRSATAVHRVGLC